MPGVPEAQKLVVITRRKLRDTSLEEFSGRTASARGRGVGSRRRAARRQAQESRRLTGGEHREVARLM